MFFPDLISARVRLAFCSVSLSPAAMSTVAGANGEPGLNALFHVAVKSSSEGACVIIRLRRVAEEAAWVMLSSRETAARTCAQVVMTGSSRFFTLPSALLHV